MGMLNLLTHSLHRHTAFDHFNISKMSLLISTLLVQDPTDVKPYSLTHSKVWRRYVHLTHWQHWTDRRKLWNNIALCRTCMLTR